jgi:hypothetical protein
MVCLFLKFYFISILLLYWENIVIFTNVLTIYISQIHPLHYSPLFPPFLRMVSVGFIFPFPYMSTYYFGHIHFPSPFPYILHPATGTNAPDRTCFTFWSFIFEKKNSLFKIAIQGVSLWHFHEYMYHILNCFIPAKVSVFYIHCCIENTSPIFTLFTSFFYPPPPIGGLPLVIPVFHSCPLLFRYLLIIQWDFRVYLYYTMFIVCNIIFWNMYIWND